MWEGQAHGRHSALGGKRIERKRVPSRVYMTMYPIVVANHFNIVLYYVRNARWVICFCQFLWVVR